MPRLTYFKRLSEKAKKSSVPQDKGSKIMAEYFNFPEFERSNAPYNADQFSNYGEIAVIKAINFDRFATHTEIKRLKDV
jgi:hypothetical protein